MAVATSSGTYSKTVAGRLLMRDLQCHKLCPVRRCRSFTISVVRLPASVRTTECGSSSQTSKNDSLTVSDPSVRPVMGLQHMASSAIGVWVW